MKDIEALALSKVKLNAGVRDRVAPGTYNVDFTVRVQGSLKVEESETYTPTTHVPLIPAMAIALQRAGVQREGIVTALVEAMQEALLCDEPMRTAHSAAVKEAEQLFRAGLAQLPRETRMGKVHANIKVS